MALMKRAKLSNGLFLEWANQPSKHAWSGSFGLLFLHSPTPVHALRDLSRARIRPGHFVRNPPRRPLASRFNRYVTCGADAQEMSSGVVFLASTPGARSMPVLRKRCWTKAEQNIEHCRERRFSRPRNLGWRKAIRVPSNSRRE